MANSQIQAGFIVNGQVFATRGEANAFVRKPQIEAALKLVTSGNTDLATFLMNNEDEIMGTFDNGIKRVTKVERKKLNTALEYLKTLGDPKLKFISEAAEAIAESFRWLSVKRLNAEEKSAETLAALSKLSDESCAKWIIANKDQLEAAYNAGVEKRQPPAAGASGLAEYLAAKKADKDRPGAFAAYQAKKNAEKAAKKAAAKA